MAADLIALLSPLPPPLLLPFLCSRNATGNYNLLGEAMLVDAATLDALLAVLPTASPPPTSGGGRNGGGSSAGGARNGQGGRRMGRELLMHAFGRTARPGGQKQGGQQQGGAQQAPAVSGYAVLAASIAAGVTWGGQLMGAKMPAAAVECATALLLLLLLLVDQENGLTGIASAATAAFEH
ncbi:unnamed protein product [Closterium sp. NIES-64]|nr:unnamed protein product [Closterium sp. NIES-64]CAI6007982.1 unnamed protein product [Closterium sp. NIES-65]